MKASELIARLQDSLSQYGDLPVYVCSTGGSNKVTAVQKFNEQSKRVGLTTIYKPERLVVFGNVE